MLEWSQTSPDDSCKNKVQARKCSNSLIPTNKSVCPVHFKHVEFNYNHHQFAMMIPCTFKLHVLSETSLYSTIISNYVHLYHPAFKLFNDIVIPT